MDGPSRLKVAISGRRGLVGSALADSLERDQARVLALVRGEPGPDPQRIAWDVRRGVLEPEKLDGVDAVVHLAGENIAAGRWSARQKARIRDSRVLGTESIARALAAASARPRVLVAASAIGFYGDRGDEAVDEASAAGTGFLSDTCREWEAATAVAAEAGVRVVNLRIGVVLSRHGGALTRMLPVFRLGLGGPLGDGDQYMSWVGLDDLVRILRFAIERDDLAGAVNATAPNPVTNREFTGALARVVRRPAFLAVPAVVIRLALGQMGRELLLGGARVLPRRLDEAGFRFEHPLLEGALRAALA